jgi:hypothetical protein
MERPGAAVTGGLAENDKAADSGPSLGRKRPNPIRAPVGDEPLQCRAVTGPDVQTCIDVSHAPVKSDLQALGNPINGPEH